MENRGVGENSASSADLEQLWEKTLEQARRELGETCVAQWIYPVKLTEINGDSAVLAAATGFLADWVERNYGRQLLRFLQKQRPKIKRVRFTIEPGLGGDPDIAAPNGRDRASKPGGRNGSNPADEASLQSARLLGVASAEVSVDGSGTANDITGFRNIESLDSTGAASLGENGGILSPLGTAVNLY